MVVLFVLLRSLSNWCCRCSGGTTSVAALIVEQVYHHGACAGGLLPRIFQPPGSTGMSSWEVAVIVHMTGRFVQPIQLRLREPEELIQGLSRAVSGGCTSPPSMRVLSDTC